MTSPSMLVRRRLASTASPPQGIVIALHGEVGGLDDLVPTTQGLKSHFDILAVEAPRRVHDPDWNRRVYRWFDIQVPGQPEPITFGDSLFQVEQLIYEVSDAGDHSTAKPYLLGHDQGATLALVLAAVVPEFLSGVIAVCGSLPLLSAWHIPERPLDSLPVFLVYDTNDPELPAELVTASASELTRRGADVRTSDIEGARALPATVGAAVNEWLGEAK